MNKFTFSVAGLAFLALAASSAQAAIIDDFSTGVYSGSINTGSLKSFQAGTMVGGDRHTHLEVQSSTGLSIQIDAVAGILALSSQAQVDGFACLTYGVAAPSSAPVADDMNLDLSAPDQFVINVLSYDLDTEFKIELYSSTTGNTSSVTKTLTGQNTSSLTQVVFNYSEFTGINFGDIDRVLVKIDPLGEGDLVITSVEAVPEPATMALLAGAAALARRKRVKKA
ncbi:MAG: PEP-CTERM sorting domain-containing protein [Armatimonadetes bacterium]|nr:PEP-CTERM sorting domain-containing protein [Armatimonadota bacterium]